TDVRGLSPDRRWLGAPGGTLRRFFLAARSVGLLAGVGRAGRCGRRLRNHGTDRAAHPFGVPRLRLRGHHRSVRGPAASCRRRVLQLHHGAVLYRWRALADTTGDAQRDHRDIPGHSPVLPAGLRCADLQANSLEAMMEALAPLIAASMNAGTP